MNNYFATNLKYLMKQLRISQEQLALHANVRSTTISNYINKISSPGLKEFVDICHYFGISTDVFLFQNFEEGKVITHQYIDDFKKNGKGNGKLIGKPLDKKVTNYEPENLPLSTVNEGQETLLWSVLNVLKQMDGKLDVVRAGVEALSNKKA